MRRTKNCADFLHRAAEGDAREVVEEHSPPKPSILAPEEAVVMAVDKVLRRKEVEDTAMQEG